MYVVCGGVWRGKGKSGGVLGLVRWGGKGMGLYVVVV